jgi:hypothetical protein
MFYDIEDIQRYEGSMKLKLTWSCRGISFTGTVGTLSHCLKAIFAEDESLFVNDGVDMGRAGEIIQLMLVELHAQKENVELVIGEGHYFRHVCGRFFAPSEWNALPIEEVNIPALTVDVDVLMPSRKCSCGSQATYASLSLYHRDDITREMCTTKGGLA